MPLWGQRKPSGTSCSEQREGQCGINRALFSQQCCGYRNLLFFLLDFPLPWLLLIVVVSDRTGTKSSAQAWCLCLALCPNCKFQSIFHRHKCPGRKSPCCSGLCASWGLLQNAFCQRECHTAGRAWLPGRGCALALEQKLLGFGRVLIICKVALLELGRVS